MNLKKNISMILLLSIVTLGLALSGCSSGGSSDSATAPSQSKSSTIYGIAALGTTAPGTVSAKDSSVPAQEKTAVIGSNGSFTMDVNGLNPPYVLKAVSTDSSGTVIQMYSISMTGGRTNINEITDVAFAAAANGVNPENLYAMSDRDVYRRASDDFEALIRRLQTVLAPLFALYNVSGNPATDSDENLNALLNDVRFFTDDGRVRVKNRATGALIFSGPLRDPESGTFYPENMPAGPGGSTGSTTCSSFTYSGWGTCQSDGTQARTVVSSSPAGCTGGIPELSQACIYVPPACTYNYSNWGACQSNGTQARTVLQTTPTGCTGTPILSQSCTYVPTCSSFTYSAWGACQSDGTQTRAVATSSPAGCTGGTPALSQSCTYVPPVNACTSFTYSAWGACQSNNTQTRTVATSSPAGCTGGTPALSQSCTYVPPVNACTAFTYSAWGACQSNNTQTRTVATSSPAGCTGGTPVLSQSCTYVSPSPTPVCGSCHAIPPSTGQHSFHSSSLGYQCSACHGVGYTSTLVTATTTHMNGTVNTAASINYNAPTDSCSPGCHATRNWNVPTCSAFTYSAWGACQSDNTQTRTVAISSPAGCTGGTPILSQSCTYIPPVTTCSSFTYSAWGACQSNGIQTRTLATSSPAGCTGGTPILSQACAYVPPVNACTSFTYSAWGACQSNNTQSRTVATSSPAGCTGGSPILSQSCTYVPPVTACTSFTYSAWGACQSNNTQTRTVATRSPAGCTGGTPVLSQTCTYVPPTQACGSCHAIPPASGKHSFHVSSLNYQCSTCHGAGYTSTSVTATTHQNGVVNNVASLNYNTSTNSCSPGCHGTRTW